MHPINRLLNNFGLQLAVVRRMPRAFKKEYRRRYAEVKRNNKGFGVFQEIYYEVGAHPMQHSDFELAFASRLIAKYRPESILDIGSWRYWIIGLLAHYNVTTIDVRDRTSLLSNETIVTSDAKQLRLPDDTFDAVTSICALEHFGLGRYGDDFDLDADRKAMTEMARVLKPGGHLIFTTQITRSRPSIGFNGARIYSYEMIRELCAGLTCVEEKFFNKDLEGFCSLEEVRAKPKHWDVYCGCWTKR
jgi:SAM-dependent methyltransferase